MVSLLLATVFVLQNPAPPDVKLLTGWKVHYWASEGHGKGALLGPDGEEIVFPGYVQTGSVAEVTGQLDSAAVLLKTVLDGRRVDIAIRPNGFLAVSFPPLPHETTRTWRSFDYWTTTRTARQAVQAVLITLTRLEVKGPEDRSNEALKLDELQFATASENYPFDRLQISSPFQVSAQPTSLEAKSWSVKWSSPFPEKVKWEDKASLLGREIRVGEDNSGQVWVAVSGTKGAFMSSGGKQQGAVIALMAALAYKPG